MKVEVIRAWPRRHETVRVELPEGARVADAVKASGFSDLSQETAYAIFGATAASDTPLKEGDRVELLRPLQIDPKEARRRRARKPL
ncbi:RnfH family protein [Pseudoxanthomonas sp. UTMC 1351]|uniref:RnfH family protein n=1 Tax=Pseudoxanthomonas sp. UTMC 1351 TaxID=2695853 RepID=UPI0034CD15C6